MKFPQCPEQEFFSASGVGFINAIVDQLQLLLVQTDYYFSKILVVAGHDSVSTRSSASVRGNLPANPESRSWRIHHRDGVDFHQKLRDNQGADLDGRARRRVVREVPGPDLLHRGQIRHFSEENGQAYYV